MCYYEIKKEKLIAKSKQIINSDLNGVYKWAKTSHPNFAEVRTSLKAKNISGNVSALNTFPMRLPSFIILKKKSSRLKPVI